MSIYSILQPMWHYFKCVILLRQEITNRKKGGFYSFGKKSIINKPFLQLSGIENISIGEDTTILSGCRLCVYGKGEQNQVVMRIGNRCYLGYNLSVLGSSSGTIRIGDDVLLASNVLVTNENHGMDPELDTPYMNQQLTAKDVEIGDGCWIGEKVCILPGVFIGKKCVIGAGSVVVKSIPDYSIAVGNPARVIKRYDFIEQRWKKV